MRASVVVLLFCLTACASEPPPAAPEPDAATRLSTPLGDIVGFVNGYGAHTWLGIPFAAAPVGDQRWRAPRPAVAWDGEREALAFGSPCAQYGSPLGGATPDQIGKPMGSEDCLYLNVWAPPGRAGTPVPVMVWIHGGGNVIGHGGYYDGGHLARGHDVVVITLNYRMGPLGWFRHASLRARADAADASGNYGTLDLVQALRWVQDNIAAFGGDPTRVTVFGESAGGTNIYSLLLSPGASGLFHRAIVQSGGLGFATLAAAENFTDDADPGNAYSSNEVLAKLLVKDGRAADRAAARTMLADMSHPNVAAYLRGKTTWEIFDLYLGGAGALGPSSPKLFQDGEIVRAGEPLALMANPETHNVVPVIVGTNRDEPKLFMVGDPEQVTSMFGIPLYTKDPQSYEREARYGALSWKRGGADDPARALTKALPGRVYAYRWDWDEEGRRLGFIDVGHLLGAAHGLEIPFVFGHWELGASTQFLFDDDNAEGRFALSDAMMGYWAAMAHDGDPGTGGGNHPRWSPWSEASGKHRTLVLDTAADGGIRMTDIEVTANSLLAAMEAEPGLDTEGRCRLFARVFRFEDEQQWVDAAWDRLAGGGCTGLDRVALSVATTDD